MDGIDGNGEGVFVVAATNRLETIDSALVRKGRFHHLLYVPIPSHTDMLKMINYFGQKYGLSFEVREELKMKLKEGMSGADVENLCREGGMDKIKEVVLSEQYKKLRNH